MANYLSPFSTRQFIDANGNPYTGAKLFTYAVGSTTKATTYKNESGSSAHANPIILNTKGEPADGSGVAYPIWQAGGTAMKYVLAPSTDTDPPVSAIETWDNIDGINDTSISIDQWISGGTPTYISANKFSLVGDQTTTYHVGRRLKTTNSGGTIYSTISVSAYTTLTTITVVNDSGSLDSGLSAVSYGLASATNTSIPNVSALIDRLKGARYGNIWAHNATDVTNDWDITAGGCMDSTQAYWISTAALIKQADVAWAVGTNAGMLDTGAVGNSDYYIWAIARSDTGVTDYLSSLSSTAPTMPSNYDYKRLIGWFKRLAGVNTLMNVYEMEGGGVEVAWRAPTVDVNLAATLTVTRRTDAVKVPLNFSVVAHLSVIVKDAASNFEVKIMCPDETDAAITNAGNISGAASAVFEMQSMHIRTSAAGLIAARADTATIDFYYLITQGFRWARRN